MSFARFIASRLGSLAPRLALLAASLLPAACAQASHGISNREVTFDALHFRVVTLDLRQVHLGIHWRNPATGKPFGSIQALRAWGAAHGRKLLFATNAGIYDAAGDPLGLYIENGKTIKPLNTAHGNAAAGNFSLLPNGVFVVDAAGQASVQTTKTYAVKRQSPRIATQSGPMLVIDGKLNPHFDAASSSAKWRSGVCARAPDTVIFVVSSNPVNFDTFARLFRDKLGCRNALYLDGSLSQVYVGGSYHGAPAFMVKPYAGIFSVFAPAQE